jgi:hypothetical protein
MDPKVLTENPFSIPMGTERILIMGERDRELKKIDSEKYKLM